MSLLEVTIVDCISLALLVISVHELTFILPSVSVQNVIREYCQKIWTTI